MNNLDQTLSRLADFEPSPFPVLSLYLRADRDGAGSDRFLETATKQLSRKVKTYPSGSEERKSMEADQERILELLDPKSSDRPVAASLAIFACHGAGLFEVVELGAELQQSKLVVAAKPDLFQLAWMQDRYARYAVVLADSQGARLFVFGLGAVVQEDEVDGESVRRQKNGGWSQSRYQRRRENAIDENIQETVKSLEAVVQDEAVESIILAGDDVMTARFREAMPQHLAELVEDESVRLDQNSPLHEVLEETLELYRRADVVEDADRASELIHEFRADGLACVGMGDTLDAVLEGRAEEVLMQGPAPKIKVDSISQVGKSTLAAQSSGDGNDTRELGRKVADMLITHAEKTGAEVRFLEKETALSELGGVGAFLRYRN